MQCRKLNTCIICDVCLKIAYHYVEIWSICDFNVLWTEPWLSFVFRLAGTWLIFQYAVKFRKECLIVVCLVIWKAVRIPEHIFVKLFTIIFRNSVLDPCHSDEHLAGFRPWILQNRVQILMKICGLNENKTGAVIVCNVFLHIIFHNNLFGGFLFASLPLEEGTADR